MRAILIPRIPKRSGRYRRLPGVRRSGSARASSPSSSERPARHAGIEQAVRQALGRRCVLSRCRRRRSRSGGELVDVTNLTAPGVEPHDLELSPDQVEAIATADVVSVPGRRVPAGGPGRGRRREGRPVDLLAGMPTVEPPAGARRGSRSIRMCGSIRRSTRRWSTRCAQRSRRRRPATPRRSERTPMRSRARHLSARRRLPVGLAHANERSSSRTTPRSATSLPSTGSTQEAISGLAPDAEPSAQRLAELKDLVQQRGVTTIFTEDLVSPKVAQTLADEAGVQTAVLHTLEGLTDEEVAAGRRLWFSDAGEPLDAADGAWLLLTASRGARRPAGLPAPGGRRGVVRVRPHAGARGRRPSRASRGVRGARRSQRLGQVDAREAAARLAHAHGRRASGCSASPRGACRIAGASATCPSAVAGIGGSRDGRGDRGDGPPRAARMVASAAQGRPRRRATRDGVGGPGRARGSGR